MNTELTGAGKCFSAGADIKARLGSACRRSASDCSAAAVTRCGSSAIPAPGG